MLGRGSCSGDRLAGGAGGSGRAELGTHRHSCNTGEISREYSITTACDSNYGCTQLMDHTYQDEQGRTLPHGWQVSARLTRVGYAALLLYQVVGSSWDVQLAWVIYAPRSGRFSYSDTHSWGSRWVVCQIFGSLKLLQFTFFLSLKTNAQ